MADPVVKGNNGKQGQWRTSGRKIQPVSDTPANGVINQAASPILSQYPKSKGPGDINERFAETGIGDANSQQNQLRQSQGVNRRGKAPLVSGNSVLKGKNQIRKQGMTKQS